MQECVRFSYGLKEIYVGDFRECRSEIISDVT